MSGWATVAGDPRHPARAASAGMISMANLLG
jgi:hypothetical protein